MANKSRNNRRPPSSTSYTSTLTTLVFIALCVLGIWMLTSNSVVSPKTRAAIDNSATTNAFSSITEDQPETTTTTRKNSDDSAETTINTTNNNSNEESPERTNTKSQDQKDTTTVYGDNPGNLPDDAIKNDDANTNNDKPKQEHASPISSGETSFTQTQKQKASITNEAGSENDQKNIVSEKDIEQNAQVLSEGNHKDEEEHAVARDENPNAKAEQNTESQNANASDNNREQSMGGGGQLQDVQSFDTDQGSKNNEEEMNEQQLREDKGEIMEKDQKQRPNEEPKENQNTEDESQETQKPKPEKNRRKSSKPPKKESKKSWSTQADESHGEKERPKNESGSASEEVQDLKWSLCNVTTSADFIPCLDNEKYLRSSSRKHYVHRERHCPEDAPTCLVQLPKGYKTHIQWPNSRDKVMCLKIKRLL